MNYLHSIYIVVGIVVNLEIIKNIEKMCRLYVNMTLYKGCEDFGIHEVFWQGECICICTISWKIDETIANFFTLVPLCEWGGSELRVLQVSHII